jgi:cyclopropane-fatty-acyl-phospholipid synthase
MLYKFKSRATADVIMLEPNGRQLVQIMGKTPGQGGIVTAEQIPGAIAAIEAAIAADERARAQAAEAAQDDEDSSSRPEPVHLRQRAAPLIDMLRRSAAEGRDVTW